VRDAWMGAAAVSGLAAARLAAAGVVRNTGTAALSLGTLLGAFDADALTEGLGDDWQILHNYFKRHASCSYTHPAADLALQLRHQHLGALTNAQIGAAVAELRVDTHALAAPLNRTGWDNGLGAMFSIPYAVATALLDGVVAPATADATGADRPDLFALAGKVSVAEDPELTRRLPHERATRLTAVLVDGRRVELDAPHPVGDSDHHPFTARTLPAMLGALLGDPATVDRLRSTVDDLFTTDDVGPSLRALAPLTTRTAAVLGGSA
ncbi:MmgE/PrpD family protein, partial [Streptomyces kunmingensis]|nr:MmgE/PrpD family protein [Streptomyces kunmingensis]